jgi:hypothetical protein
MKRVRISNSSLNSYGTRVITAGVDVKQYDRNPVLLYMHMRGLVIGLVKDLKIEGDDITGELVFDEATDLSKQAKKQFEFGSLKMVSAGLDILETSEKKEHLVQGQTRPSITKSRLVEVSVADIGANDDALVLYKGGARLNLSSGLECTALPMIDNKTKKIEMETRALALSLGLPETATEEQINAKISAMRAAETENATLKTQNETLMLSGITTIVEGAVLAKKITADKKDQFIELGKKIGTEELSKTFDAMSVSVKLTDVFHPSGETPAYKKLSEVPASEVMTLRSKDPEAYKKLYKAEYGVDCVLDDTEG